MKLAISNIAWSQEADQPACALMRAASFSGLEIAPTRIFPNDPYDKTAEAAVWAAKLRREQGFSIPSMQSIWYGRSEKLFGTEEERGTLLAYTKQAIRFAESIGCGNLVFGCPKNRTMPEGADPEIGISFFRAIGNDAAAHHTVIGLEANPPIYRTNYINTTAQALEMIQTVGSPGLRLNQDVGTMITNGEDVSLLEGKVSLINHVHISEPFLKPVQRRELHKNLAALLQREGYDRFISIEMGCVEDLSILERTMKYVGDVFGG